MYHKGQTQLISNNILAEVRLHIKMGLKFCTSSPCIRWKRFLISSRTGTTCSIWQLSYAHFRCIDSGGNVILKACKALFSEKRSGTCLCFSFRNLAYIPEVVWNCRPTSKGNTLLPMRKDLWFYSGCMKCNDFGWSSGNRRGEQSLHSFTPLPVVNEVLMTTNKGRTWAAEWQLCAL